MELTLAQESLRKTVRSVRKRSAKQQGITEGEAAAQCLSPTTSGFFSRIVIFGAGPDEKPVALNMEIVYKD